MNESLYFIILKLNSKGRHVDFRVDLSSRQKVLGVHLKTRPFNLRQFRQKIFEHRNIKILGAEGDSKDT